ncbi:competence type IV pilus assembly protein ComGB [Alkalibacterium sp.]|nr:MAG: type II secretion system F family protein [Alkalibacterium sp.]
MGIYQNRHTTDSKFRTSKHLLLKGVFLNRLGKMLSEGFSLKEALAFLSTVSKKESKNWVKQIERQVLEGHSLVEGLTSCHFPEQTVTQLYFALFHGDFPRAVTRAGQQLIKQSEKKRKLTAVLTYPVMLICFIVVMLFVMRTVLIPHIEQITALGTSSLPLGTRLIVQFVYEAPVILMVTGALAITGTLLLIRAGKRQSPLANLITLCRLTPSYLLQLYWSQYFSYEWGQLLNGGCSLLEVVKIMKGQKNSLLIKETGLRIEEEMSEGHSFSDSLDSFNFLTDQLKDVIRHGEQSGKLGAELVLYAIGCEEEFDTKVEQLMAFIQPVVFAVVAVMIIAIYAALLLPTFTILDTI